MAYKRLQHFSDVFSMQCSLGAVMQCVPLSADAPRSGKAFRFLGRLSRMQRFAAQLRVQARQWI
eukprot:244010-Amphidinium_carterae.1